MAIKTRKSNRLPDPSNPPTCEETNATLWDEENQKHYTAPCPRPAFTKARNVKQNKDGSFTETSRRYWCEHHIKRGKVIMLDGQEFDHGLESLEETDE